MKWLCASECLRWRALEEQRADVRIASSAPVASVLFSLPRPRLLTSETDQCYAVSRGIHALNPRSRPEADLDRGHAGAESLQRITSTARASAETDDGERARIGEMDWRAAP
jgi:hypothetical protein